MIPIKIKISEIKLINPLKKSTPNFTSLISRIKAESYFEYEKNIIFQVNIILFKKIIESQENLSFHMSYKIKKKF